MANSFTVTFLFEESSQEVEVSQVGEVYTISPRDAAYKEYLDKHILIKNDNVLNYGSVYNLGGYLYAVAKSISEYENMK